MGCYVVYMNCFMHFCDLHVYTVGSLMFDVFIPLCGSWTLSPCISCWFLKFHLSWIQFQNSGLTLCSCRDFQCYCTWVEPGFSFGFDLCSPVPVNQSSVYIGVHGLVAYTVIHCVCHKLFVYDEFKFKWWRTTQITEAKIIFKKYFILLLQKYFFFNFTALVNIFADFSDAGFKLECSWR